MTLPAGALTATVTVGAPVDISGVAGTLVSLQIHLGLPAGLVWAATGTPVEPWPASPSLGDSPVTSASLTILADQPGVLTSSTVDGAAKMVEIRSWPLVAIWVTRQSATGAPTRHVRRLNAPAAGETVDLDLLPADGVTVPATVTHAQMINIDTSQTTEMVADLAIGTVTTGAAGTPAAASLTPDGDGYVLDLTIPQGDQGDKGDPGPAGTTTWAGITDKPATYAPSAHAGSHATGQPDALTPASIGAAPALGADDNYVTDAEKARLSTSDTKTVNTITAAASVTVSTAYAVNKLTMGQNTTITPSLAAGSDPITSLHLSGAFTPTWAASVKWPDGTAPAYASPALYVFLTVDGGTSWVAVQSAKAIA